MFNLGRFGRVKPKAEGIEVRIREMMSAARVAAPRFAGARFRGAGKKASLTCPANSNCHWISAADRPIVIQIEGQTNAVISWSRADG